MSNTLNEKLSFSRYSKWQGCRKAYGYGYVQKIWPKAGTVSVDKWIDRQRGTLIHAVLQAIFSGRTPEEGAEAGFQEACFPQWRPAASEEHQAALRAVLPELTEVGRRAGEFMRANEWKPALVEAEVTHPLAGWKGFTGKVDLVAEHLPSGLKFVIDWKSTNQFKDASEEVYRTQLILYTKVLRAMGVVVHGAGVLQIKPELPKRKPKKIRVDEGSFDQVRESEDGKFRWIPSLYSEAYQENVWAEFEKAAALMSKFELGRDDVKNVSSFSCNWCDHRLLCQAELQDQDAEYILQAKYTVSGKSLSRPKSLTVVDF